MPARDPSVLVRAVEGHFRELLDAAPDAMVIVDDRGEMLLLNRQTELLFGYEREELLGRRVETLIPDRFRAGHGARREAYARDARVRPMGTGLELFGLRKDGTEFPTEISLSPVDTEHGRLVIAAIRDVSERKRGDDERHALLAREQESRAAAEQATRARDDVLAVVSHDLQNLLNAIGLNLAVLLRTPAASEAERRMRQYAETVDRSVGAMKRLLRDILEAQRMDSGRVEVALAPEDLVGLVRETVELLAPVAAEKRVQVDVRVAGESGAALCERERIQQVLQNLIGNAIHFTPTDGHVTVRVWGEARETRIAVADSGPGIPVEQIPHVFDRYWRGRGASRHGIGLGLFIVKRLIDAHGGRIWVESRAGEGASFCFALSRA